MEVIVWFLGVTLQITGFHWQFNLRPLFGAIPLATYGRRECEREREGERKRGRVRQTERERERERERKRKREREREREGI